MGLGRRLSLALAALAGTSAYASPLPPGALTVDSPQVQLVRRMRGGQLAPMQSAPARWMPRDVETATWYADNGQLEMAAKLWCDCRRDGVVTGVLSTRTGGLVRLPKKFRGRADAISMLNAGGDSIRSVFDEMFPPGELALLAADGVGLGVGVAELQPVEGRNFPVMVRLDPQFLVYRWSENRWYYRSIAGLLPITPGDGKWILHTPGGRLIPWQNSLWRAVGWSWIQKLHAQLHDANWQSKLANPARIAFAPLGSTEPQQKSLFNKLMAWGVNTVFTLLPGWDVKLVESNGRGHEAFQKTIDRSNNEIIIAIAGQSVTTDGGAGFQNSDIHKAIRADLIKETADGLAYTINTQGLPIWMAQTFGEDAVNECATVEWDVTPPGDKTSEATAMNIAAQAAKTINEAFASQDLEIDAAHFEERFGIRLTKRKRGQSSAVVPVRGAAA